MTAWKWGSRKEGGYGNCKNVIQISKLRIGCEMKVNWLKSGGGLMYEYRFDSKLKRCRVKAWSMLHRDWGWVEGEREEEGHTKN